MEGGQSMTKEQAIEIIEKMIKSYIEADECGLSNNDFKHEIKALQTVLNMLKEKDAELEKKEKMINKMIDEIMIHYQVKTMRKMCCPACKIGERACTYSGIHRNCIKQYFKNKEKE